MDLKRSLSSNAHPRSNHSDNNGYTDDFQKNNFGGLQVDKSEKVQKQRRRNKHLSNKWKHSQTSIDSLSITPNITIGIINLYGYLVYCKYLKYDPL